MVITIPLLVDISDTLLGVLLELGMPFDRPMPRLWLLYLIG